MEINMYCKQAVGEIIGKIEQNSELKTEGTKPKAEVVKFKEKRTINTKVKESKRLQIFENSINTWKERAIIMYFLLHDFLGGMDLQLTSKAFDTPKSTISTWYNEKKYWGKFCHF